MTYDIECPDCDASLSGDPPECPRCEAYLGSDFDLVTLSSFMCTVTAIICIVVWSYVIRPRVQLEEAIRLVKDQDLEGLKRIKYVNDQGYIQVEPPDGGWGGETFPGLTLVTFSYEQLEGKGMEKGAPPKRLAVWWAVDSNEGKVHSVSSVGDFADHHLLAIANEILPDELPDDVAKRLAKPNRRN